MLETVHLGTSAGSLVTLLDHTVASPTCRECTEHGDRVYSRQEVEATGTVKMLLQLKAGEEMNTKQESGRFCGCVYMWVCSVGSLQ